MPETAKLQTMTARFAPTEIGADLSRLSPADRQVLAKLVEASKIIDALFLRQVWAGNEAMLLDLVRDRTPEGRARLHYFLINKGPWSRLDHNEAFVAGAPAKPEGANFYPADAAKADIERWMQSLPEADARRADRLLHGHPTRHGGDIQPRAVQRRVPGRADARPQRFCARRPRLTSEPTLKTLPHEARGRVSVERLLRQRRRVDGADKARSSRPSARTRSTRTSGSTTRRRSSRSSPFGTRPRAPSCRSSRASCRTSRITCRSIAKYRNPKLGALAPIVVVNEIFAAGDANRGVQTAAFNLPNDERVVREKGTKRVMLKNVQDAKFAKTLVRRFPRSC